MSFCALNADACSQRRRAAVPDCRGFSTGADYIHDVCFPQPVEAGVLDCRGFSTAFPRDSQQANDFYLYAHELVFRSGRPNFVVSRLPVPSSLKINTWRTLLYDYDDQMICDFLEFGWPVGFTGDTVPIFDARTHRGALNFATQVSEHLQREVSLGRVAGPFTDPPFGGGFVTSPLNTVPKRDSEKRRVIVDLSWPKGGSVNDGIPCDSFLGDPFVTCYPTIDDIVEAIVLNSGRTRHPFLNSCLREICYLSASYDFEIRAVHLPSVLNCDSDLLSRWGSVASTVKERFLESARCANRRGVTISSDYFTFTTPW
ncbi:uncharacterized protein LOC125570161 [Nematostella vectensis]|uniref:uncharacterized protein LOC125570161 n=1 Tax=Nematostella vectensis TaxID=45351 RepID=UPI00207743BD|nr:uncharacterized protein LOC125570161 [Nematostella vectensis]